MVKFDKLNFRSPPPVKTVPLFDRSPEFKVPKREESSVRYKIRDESLFDVDVKPKIEREFDSCDYETTFRHGPSAPPFPRPPSPPLPPPSDSDPSTSRSLELVNAGKSKLNSYNFDRSPHIEMDVYRNPSPPPIPSGFSRRACSGKVSYF